MRLKQRPWEDVYSRKLLGNGSFESNTSNDAYFNEEEGDLNGDYHYTPSEERCNTSTVKTMEIWGHEEEDDLWGESNILKS